MSELQWCEARTRENLIFSHQDELIETMIHGTKPRVSEAVYRKLKKDGLLTLDRRGRRCVYQLSVFCIKILESQKMTAKDALLGLPEISPIEGYHVPHGGSRVISTEEVKQ